MLKPHTHTRHAHMKHSDGCFSRTHYRSSRNHLGLSLLSVQSISELTFVYTHTHTCPHPSRDGQLKNAAVYNLRAMYTHLVHYCGHSDVTHCTSCQHSNCQNSHETLPPPCYTHTHALIVLRKQSLAKQACHIFSRFTRLQTSRFMYKYHHSSHTAAQLSCLSGSVGRASAQYACRMLQGLTPA